MRLPAVAIAMAAALSSGAALSAAAMSAASHSILEFSDLEGWSEDDHGAALEVFLRTCRDMDEPDWATLCRTAAETRDPRRFFEIHFAPTLIENGTPTLYTGYFEPELSGARAPGGPYQYPIYALPEEAEEGPWLTRAEIAERDALEGRGLEIAWLDDPVDAYFLQVQGSGRIRLTDGTAIRVGYAGKNGHSYRSVGKELVRRGVMTEHEVDIDGIRDWVDAAGEKGRKILYHNPSYVFFREVSHVPSDRGPLGAMNRSLTARRSVAVDPAHVPLGAPVWIEKDGSRPMRRLMVAQDTGAAVEGPQRADIYFGTGESAGREAGTIRDGGRMIVLMPIQRAYALAEAL